MSMRRFNYSTLKKEVLSSSCYINKKGEHPRVGTCLSPKRVVLGDVNLSDLRDDQWKCCNNTEAVKSGIRSIGIFEDVIYIIYE